MYRLLFFIVLLNFAACKHWRTHDTTHRRDNHHPLRHPEEYFYKLANRIISTEKQFENNCRDNMFKRVREIYNQDSYALRYSIPGFEAKDLVVKVLHKAFIVSAEREEFVGLKTFWDLKILPDNLKMEEASWFLQGGELEISFPYRMPLGTEIEKYCGNISYNVFVVPMKVPAEGERPPTDNGFHFAIHDGVINANL